MEDGVGEEGGKQREEGGKQRPKGRRDREPCVTNERVRGEDEQARRATLTSDCERF